MSTRGSSQFRVLARASHVLFKALFCILERGDEGKSAEMRKVRMRDDISCMHWSLTLKGIQAREDRAPQSMSCLTW